MENRMLVPVDLAHEAAFDLIFPAATALARQRNASLHLLTVVPGELAMWPDVPRDIIDGARKTADEQLTRLAKLELSDDIEWQCEAVIGPIAATIVQRAQDLGAGLIVIASHDPKVTNLILGGVADRVLRLALCSVLVLRAADGWQWRD